MKNEPVISMLGMLDGAVVAVLVALNALNVFHLSGEQVAAVSAAVVAVSGLAAFLIRSRVVPVAKIYGDDL